MPYPFTKIEADTLGSISKWDIPLNEYLGFKFGVGFDESLFTATSRFTEDQIYSTGTLMQPDVANKQFGIPAPSWKPLEFASNALSMGLNSSLTNPNRAKDLI